MNSEMNATKPKEHAYNYGLDLLRVLSMLAIIGLHVVKAGGAYTTSTNPFVQYIWAALFMVLVCSVNVFAMLSGYLYAQKENNRHRNIIALLFETAFYYILITAVFFVLSPGQYSFKALFEGLFPPFFGWNWYIVCYVLLFFCIPYMNMLTSKLSQRDFQKLLILLFVLLSIVPSFGFADYFKTGYGYSPWWLMYCYLIGAYIRMYDVKISRKWICFILGSCLLLCALIFVVSFSILGKLKGASIVRQYTSPTAVVLGAMFLCML